MHEAKRKRNILKGLVPILFLWAAGCGTQPAVTPQFLAGVWLEEPSGVVYWTNHALRFHGNGRFEHGTWEPDQRVFSPAPHFGSTPGFTNSYEISADGKRILLGLDGAEESGSIAAEGADGLLLFGDSADTPLQRYRRIR